MAFDPTRPGLNSTDRTSWITSGSLHEKFQLFFNLTDPAGVDDYIWYLSNTGTKTWILDEIALSTTATALMKFQTVTGTPTYTGGEVDVTPVPLDLPSTSTLAGVFKRDTDITGISSAGVLWTINAAPGPRWVRVLRPNLDITVPPSNAIALITDSATGIIQGTLKILVDTTPD